jgi:hypothetical protein
MSVTNILSKLKEINNSNLISVFVPSAKKEISFKPLSAKQQKDLIKTGLDGNLSGVTLSNTINQIILDNSTEKHQFLVTDRYPIIISLRKQAFGSQFVLKDEDKKTIFDIDVILNKELKYSLDDKMTIALEGTSLTADLDVVTLEDDIKINNFQIDKLKKNKEDENIGDTVGSLFIYEILKFVTKVKVNSDEIDMKSIPIKDRMVIIENIPVTLNNIILEYIQIFRKEETEYVTIDGNIVPLDARFFSKE